MRLLFSFVVAGIFVLLISIRFSHFTDIKEEVGFLSNSIASLTGGLVLACLAAVFAAKKDYSTPDKRMATASILLIVCSAVGLVFYRNHRMADINKPSSLPGPEKIDTSSRVDAGVYEPASISVDAGVYEPASMKDVYIRGGFGFKIVSINGVQHDGSARVRMDLGEDNCLGLEVKRGARRVVIHRKCDIHDDISSYVCRLHENGEDCSTGGIVGPVLE